MRVTCTAEVDLDDVMSELSDEDLVEELESRRKGGEAGSPMLLLQLVYEEYRLRGDATEKLREYCYQVLGRVL